MTTVYVIQTGRTVWEERSRFESAAGSPLTDEGAGAVKSTAEELTKHKIKAIYASKGESEQQTAGLVAEVLGLKVRTNDGLREIDYGMWQGLTVEEIKRRHPKVYKQWTGSPVSVRPSGGESLDEVQERLRKAMREIVKRHRGGSALLVLRPVALGLLRCVLDGSPVSGMWSHVDPAFTWDSYEMDGREI